MGPTLTRDMTSVYLGLDLEKDRIFQQLKKRRKKRKKQAASKKEAGGDAKHVFFFYFALWKLSINRVLAFYTVHSEFMPAHLTQSDTGKVSFWSQLKVIKFMINSNITNTLHHVWFTMKYYTVSLVYTKFVRARVSIWAVVRSRGSAWPEQSMPTLSSTWWTTPSVQWMLMWPSTSSTMSSDQKDCSKTRQVSQNFTLSSPTIDDTRFIYM